jgi:hypothetical protein
MFEDNHFVKAYGGYGGVLKKIPWKKSKTQDLPKYMYNYC